jgi:hypothetical protein
MYFLLLWDFRSFGTPFGTRVLFNLGGSNRVSLERYFDGLSNGERNLDLAQLGTKLWDFEIFPT